MKYITTIVILIFTFNISLFAQQKKSSPVLWQAILKRADGKNIHFTFEEKKIKQKPILIIRNATERLKVDNIVTVGDSVVLKMPVFESSITTKISPDIWEGIWTRGTSGNDLKMAFEASKSNIRYPLTDGIAKHKITGRWAVKFASDTGKIFKSVAEFVQNGNKVTGTFLTPTGDYRFLEGVVTGNHMIISGFDGAHAVMFEADITDSKTLSGKYYSGPKFSEEWRAVKNEKAVVQFNESAMYVKPGESKLNFSFPDLDSNMVSINDQRFKDKVVVIQLMGSWCPNCMDETAFLSDYYSKKSNKGVEMVALAYEYSTDFQRSKNSLLKFQKRFNVQYPVLITGVKVSDTLRTEKTLPQVTRIRVFPSSIILDKNGNIRKLDNGFVGPATGVHYDAYKKEFYKTIDKLLLE